MTLWAHQVEALRAMDDKPAWALFMEPRTGKTRIIGAEMERMWARGLRRFLVICPKTVAGVWQDEVGSCFDLSDGPVRDRLFRPEGVHIVNYDALDPLLPDILRWRPEYVVLDEAHKIKTFSAHRSKAAHKIGDVAKMRRILTGTPDPKSYVDYLSEYRFLEPSIFGKHITPYRERYCIQHPRFPNQVIGYRNLGELKDKLFSIATRKRRSECFDLPQVQEIRRRINLPPEIRDLYRKVAREGVAEFDGQEVGHLQPIARLTVLQQLTSGFIPYNFIPEDGFRESRWAHRVKIDAVVEELEETTACEEKAVVFCRFRKEISEYALRLEGLCPTNAIHGDTPQFKRTEYIDRFNNLPGPQILVVQIETGSLGISLAGADVALFPSLTFNAAEFQQARDRIWKPGLDRKLSYVYFVVPNSIDTFILDNLAKKRNVSDALLWGGFEQAAEGGDE